MKADVSIPNPVFRAAEQLAQSLGISLSDLYTAALTTYVTTPHNGDVTEALNRVYESESSAMDLVLVRIQLTSVGEVTW